LHVENESEYDSDIAEEDDVDKSDANRDENETEAEMVENDMSNGGSEDSVSDSDVKPMKDGGKRSKV
jgi:hypothetical protein